MMDHLQLRFCAAADSYAAAELIADGGGTDAWRFLIAQADELCADGRAFGNRENVLRAIKIYYRALGLVGREKLPLEWAATQHHLGGALVLLGGGDEGTGPLPEAVDVYLAALEEWTLERIPADWTKAQIDLGNALQLLGEQESDPERLRQAAEAYGEALAQHSRQPTPFELAAVYNRLGDPLAALKVDEGSDPANTSRRPSMPIARPSTVLIRISRNPLESRPKTILAGRSRRSLRTRPAQDLLHQAVAAYQAVLDERCRDLAPSDLAATNANLGNALVTISERENCNSMLEEAAMAYRAALAARPVNEAPLDTAGTHIKLAYALGGLWNRTRSQHVLNEALNAVEAALGLINECRRIFPQRR